MVLFHIKQSGKSGHLYIWTLFAGPKVSIIHRFPIIHTCRCVQLYIYYRYCRMAKIKKLRLSRDQRDLGLWELFRKILGIYEKRLAVRDVMKTKLQVLVTTYSACSHLCTMQIWLLTWSQLTLT